MNRSKQSKRSARSAGGRKAPAASRRAKPRRAADSAAEDSSLSAAKPAEVPRSTMDTLTEPFSKMLNFQRRLLRAGADAALDNPASKLVKDSVAGSLQGGVKKLEEVFDERVAAALERMGMPSAEMLQALIAKVDALTEARGASKARKRK